MKQCGLLTLSTAASPVLSFFPVDFSDLPSSIPEIFVGSINRDGVSISADGATWYRIMDAVRDLQWEQKTVDLGALASSIGIGLGTDFKVKFQQR